MKIKMTVYSTKGDPEEVEGEDIGLEIHGKRFFVHETPAFGGVLPPFPACTVTEASTGFAVCHGATKGAAVKKAKKLLAKISVEKMEAACAKAKKRLSDVLRVRKMRNAV